MAISPFRLTLCFLMLLGLDSVAQNNLNSLLNRRSNLNKGEEKAKVLLELANHFLNNNLDSCSLFAEEALVLSRNIKFSKGEMKALNVMGNVLQRRQDVDAAMLMYKDALAIAEKLNDKKGKAIAINNIAILYTDKNDYPKAMELYQEATRLEVEIGDSTGMAEGYNNIGVIYYYMGDIARTAEYLEKSIVIEEKLGNKSVLKKGYINLGAILEYQKEYAKALDYYTRAYELSKSLNDLKEMGICLHNMGGMLMSLGRYDEAEAKINEAIQIKVKLGDNKGLATTYVNVGLLYQNRNNVNKAEEYYLKALNLAKSCGAGEVYKETHKYMATLKEKIGDFKKALEYERLFNAIQDSLFSQEMAIQVSELEVKYKAAEKDRDNLKLRAEVAEKDKESAAKDLRISRRNNWILGISGGAVILVLSLLVLMQQKSRRARVEKERALAAERERGLQQLVSGIEEERRRIARDLHDGVGQQISGIKLAVQNLADSQIENPKVADSLATLNNLLQDAGSDVRRISHEMMPKVLVEFGLIPALEDLFRKSFEGAGIAQQFDHFNFVDRLPQSIEITMFRVSQEIVSNILKYAKATHVSVQLYILEGIIIYSIEDNGVGMPTENNSNGHGLSNIRTRLQMVEGRLEVSSGTSGGTIFGIRLPLPT